MKRRKDEEKEDEEKERGTVTPRQGRAGAVHRGRNTEVTEKRNPRAQSGVTVPQEERRGEWGGDMMRVDFREDAMRQVLRGFVILVVCGLLAGTGVFAAETAALRVAIAGLVHGHADGFLANSAKRADIKIVGISEPDRKLFDQYAAKFGLDAGLYHADVEEMLVTTKPQAVLVYASTLSTGRLWRSARSITFR